MVVIILNWGKMFTHDSVKVIDYASFTESDLEGYVFVKNIFESTDGSDSKLILDNRNKLKDANIIAYKILDLDPSKSGITDIYYEYDTPVLLQHGHSKDLNVICFPSNEFDIEFYTSDEKCFKVNVFDSSLSCQSCLNLPYCGDSSCNGDETANTCYSDCGSCGDGICTSGEENMTSCYTDCGTCGDGICTFGEENATTCYDDCGECGNSILEGPETCDSDTESCTTSVSGITYVGTHTCLGDCSAYGTCTTTKSCGDGICQNTGGDGETVSNCVVDCHSCGDGICSDGYETEVSCPADCLQYTCSLGDTDNGDGTCTALIDASYDNSLKYTTSNFDYDATTGVVNGGTYVSVGSYEFGGAAPALCVLEDTLINVLRNDEEKEMFVQDVLLSDYILSWDFNQNEYIYVPVLQKFNNTINEYYIINNKLKVTSLHPIYIKDKGFIYPEEITYNDYLLNSNGDFEKVNSVKFVENVDENIYNFETGNHFYFANGYLTHNPAPMSPYLYYIHRSYFFFDTSYISSYGTVNSADFKFTVSQYDEITSYSFILQKTDNSTYPHNPLQTGDFDESYYSGNLGSISNSSFGSPSIVSLNSTGLTEVTNSLGDTFKFVLRSDCDVGHSCDDEHKLAYIYRYNSANPPQLEITYSPTSQVYCGNGVVETGEDCECGVGAFDMGNVGENSCVNYSSDTCINCVYTGGFGN